MYDGDFPECKDCPIRQECEEEETVCELVAENHDGNELDWYCNWDNYFK